MFNQITNASSITEAEIESIVHNFYSKVRDDQLLGPVFAEEMTEDWDAHLIKMCNFWTTVMTGRAAYKGNPVEAHRHLRQISDEHFTRWLALFKETLEEVCANADHANAFYSRASNMARVLTAALPISTKGVTSCK